MAVVSISSRISRGYIGNTATGFALRTLGHDVWEVPTVMWNHHPGHGQPSGPVISAMDMTAMLSGFARKPWCDEINLVITGYFRDAEQVAAAARFVCNLKSKGQPFLYVCDPVMADVRGRYVPEDVSEAIAELLIPLADVITPNRFELELLSGKKLEANAALVEAADGLSLGTTLITSAFGERGGIGTLLSKDGVTSLLETRHISAAPHGTGDLMTGLFAGKLLETDPVTAMTHAVNAVWQVIERTARAGHDELLLAQNRRALTAPATAASPRPVLDREGAGLVAGVDGCPAGWLAVFWDGKPQSSPWAEIFPKFEDILKTGADIVAVDMPIGLPETSGRACETLARELIGERRSSVFAIPCRAAVMERDYGKACEINLAHSSPPRKISKQSFMLFPKIREIDRLITPQLQDRVFEVHPEVSFYVMNGEQPLSEPKKIKGRLHEAGLDLRRDLLERAGFPVNGVQTQDWRRSDAATDDLLDACAACWSANRIRNGSQLVLPEEAVRDERGLRMEMNA